MLGAKQGRGRTDDHCDSLPSWPRKAAGRANKLLRLLMDREMQLQHLAEAERHVTEGHEHVARQREVVAQLERDGHDATEARKLLATFEVTQRGHEEHYASIKRELEC